MAKPRSPLSQLRTFERLLARYTGRRLLIKPLQPIYRAIPSPAAVILRALAL